jgi:hypothetical protein
MESQPESSASSDFEVTFNREIAWTVIYSDAQGRLMFVFEPGKGQKSIFLRTPTLLDNKVLSIQDQSTRLRVGLASERTKEFLQKCGYEVCVEGVDQQQ